VGYETVELDRDLGLGPRKVERATLSSGLHPVVDAGWLHPELANHPEHLCFPDVASAPELGIALLQ
jgi:hypothetical protein